MWHSVHVVYYAPAKDALLLDAIAPALEEACAMTPGGGRGYVRRHWLYGPHFRLNVAAPAELFTNQIEPSLRSTLGRYLAANPSRTSLDPDEYARRSATWGQSELVPGPYLPLRPDNSVHVVPYEARTEILGGAEMVCEMETYLSAVRTVLFDLLARTRDNKALRLTSVFACMTLLACLYPGGLRYGHLSFRSHAEAYLAGNGPQMRAQFERARDRNLAELVRTMEQLLGALQDGMFRGRDELLVQWSAVHAGFFERYLALSSARKIPDHFAAARSYAAAAGGFTYFDQDRVGPQSEFHSVGTDASRAMYHSPAFDAYRLLLNFFYLNLPTLDVDASAKFLLCFLVAEVAERVLGVTWRQILGR